VLQWGHAPKGVEEAGLAGPVSIAVCGPFRERLRFPNAEPGHFKRTMRSNASVGPTISHASGSRDFIHHLTSRVAKKKATSIGMIKSAGLTLSGHP